MALTVPKEYCDVLPQVRDLLQRAQGAANAEVEGKLGYFDTRGNFDSGVPLQTFNRLLKKMHSFGSWDRVVDWTDTHDYFFENSIRGTKTADGDAFFLCKTVVEHVNLRAPERQSALRISWKQESPVDAPVGYPNLCRIKKRMTYRHKQFEFAFTYVWQGKTVEEAQSRQPIYEIEIECMDLQEPKGTQYLALSFLMKLGDLLHQPGQPLHLEII